MTKLCLKALENEIEVEYVRDLIRKRGLIPDTPPYDCEHWPWPLKIYTLGRFEIVRDARPLQHPRKSPRMPIELLKAVISGGVRGISEDRLSDALWPDADGVTAHQAFATTLHRLRQLLGDEKAVLLRDGRVAVDWRSCWVDAFVFEALLERRALREKQFPEAVRLTEKALALYGGRS
jgi:DNA-binding SARP family transcriptional activator